MDNSTCQYPETFIVNIPPHSEAVEKSVLGSVIISPTALDGVCRMLSGEHFYIPVHRRIFETILDMNYHGEPIDVVTLSERLPGNEALISEMVEGDTATHPHVLGHAKILHEKFRLRRLQEKTVLLQNAIAIEDNERVDRLQIEISEIKREDDFTEKAYRFSWEDNPPEEPAIMTFCDNEILSSEGITLLTGPAGKGKTQICLAAISSLINRGCDSLGLKVTTDCVYIDTENPLKSFRKNVRRSFIRAGHLENSEIKNVQFYNIRAIESWEDKQGWLFDMMAKSEFKLFIVDGAGDFVLDVNDTPSCVGFVSRLCASTLRTGCGVFLTLHGNPSVNSEKARGVLGSELLRKADCSLLLKAEGDLRLITTEFSLGKNRTANDTMTTCFRWDSEKGMHLSCEAPEKPHTTSKTQEQQMAILKRIGTQEVSFKTLTGIICAVAGIGYRAACDRVKTMTGCSLIEKHDNLYQVIDKFEQHWSNNV